MPCSLCGEEGHNKTSCPKKKKLEAATSSQTADPAAAVAASAGLTADTRDDSAQASKKPRLDDDPKKGLAIEIPKDDEVDVDVPVLMTIVVREVHRSLPLLLVEVGVFKNNTPLYEHPPLDIKTMTVDKGALSSYKEPWRKARAVQAVDYEQMYEAGGSAFWFRHSTSDPLGDEFPLENVPWPLLCSFRDNLFQTPPGASRILFPHTLVGYLKDAKLVEADFFPGNITLTCGVPTLWAMYLKMLQAMQARDFHAIKLLYQSALTCTVRIRTGDTIKDCLLDTIRISETTELRKKGCTDTWVKFCEKLKRLKKLAPPKDDADELQHLQDLGMCGTMTIGRELGTAKRCPSLGVSFFLSLSLSSFRPLQLS